MAGIKVALGLNVKPTKNKVIIKTFSIRAICTWGQGPDVLINTKGHDVLLMAKPENLNKLTHGTCPYTQIDLTIEEAFNLAKQLNIAATKAQELETSLKRV